ncbi:MAG: hypothetical protein QW156_04265 [Candidatus Aenigmatarchaeota archaeon]
MLTKQESQLRQEAEKLAKEWESSAKAKDQFMLSVQHHLRILLTSRDTL